MNPFHQTLTKIFQLDPARKFHIAIPIAFENLIRINQTLIEKLMSDLDFIFSSRL